MESSTPSLVSKAKTAFHSAAAKAEKVLTDIKSDRKNDREIDGQSNKGLGKVADNETILTDISSESQEECYNESKHSRWKPMHLGKKQDWQQYLKTTKKWVEKRKKAENSDSDIPMDESLNQIDQGNICEVKSSEMGSTGEEDTPNASNMVTIPPASVIKQLAMAVEDAKKFKSMKDLLTSIRDYSTVKEKSGLSFSTMKSLVLREKEEKSTECDDDEEVISLIPFLFDAEEHFLQRKNGSDSAAIAMTSFPRDIHGAPPESFIVRLSEIIGSFKTLRNMALFWYSVVAELRRLWSEGKPVPRVPLDVNPDLSLCLLHQKLQVINCCIARKMRRDIANKSLDSVMKEASQNSDGLDVSLGHLSSILLLYARISTGDFVLRLGADHPSENLTMLETGEPVYSPITQEGQLFTEDLIRETEEFVLRTGSVGAGCSQLLSDMQAFKAANPGCILEDFVRWHSPPDWIEAVSSDETKNSFDGGDSSSRRGQLSNRMQKEGNLWRELWETAKPVPAVKQTPLFDEDMAVESILNSLEDIPPSELFEQLFVAILSSGFVVAEAALPANSGLCKLFYDCKDYVIATCQGDTSSDNIDDLCQVYQTVETILVHPDEGLKILKQSEAMTSGETKRPFKKIILNFVSRDKQVSRKAASKDQKNSDTNQGRPFSNFFDGKASLFGKKQPKPSTLPPAVPSSLDENDWTII